MKASSCSVSIYTDANTASHFLKPFIYVAPYSRYFSHLSLYQTLSWIQCKKIFRWYLYEVTIVFMCIKRSDVIAWNQLKNTWNMNYRSNWGHGCAELFSFDRSACIMDIASVHWFALFVADHTGSAVRCLWIEPGKNVNTCLLYIPLQVL